MNPLRTLESMIAGLVEGTFGRVFKTEVRPMELARKLAREMDENTTVSVSRVYAPNEYSVWLSPRDRARYEGVEHEVIDELCAYLLEHARGEDLALPSRPNIVFHTDERLALGEFGIEARMAKIDAAADERLDRPRPEAPAVPPAARLAGGPSSPARGPREALAEHPEEPDAVGNTMIFGKPEPARDRARRGGARRRPRALLVLAGRRMLIPPRGATIGRSRDCDVVLDDAGVSRRHAELRPEGSRLDDRRPRIDQRRARKRRNRPRAPRAAYGGPPRDGLH